MFKTKTKRRATVNTLNKRSPTDGLVLKGEVCKDGSIVSPYTLEGYGNDLINLADEVKGSLTCLLKLNYSHPNGYTQDLIVSKFITTQPITVDFIESLLSTLVNESNSTVGRVNTFKHEFYIFNVRVLDKVIETFNLNSFNSIVNDRDPLYITI